MPATYAKRIRSLLSGAESKVFRKLTSPRKIQDFIDSLAINMERDARTYMSPRRVLATGQAHCVEGALLAAAALAYHGERPLLLDFQAAYDDEDHVVALFRQNGHWGAISKTNHPGLRYRDPIHQSLRGLAASYFHEYYLWDGRKSLRFYSKPFDLARYPPESWVTAQEDLDRLVHALDASAHSPIIPKGNLRKLRPASAFEIYASATVEWREDGRKTPVTRRDERSRAASQNS
jgi:2-polyprenyl-6-methoxyphenol hydroxylase-like FAD-dependent oxidoreductase